MRLRIHCHICFLFFSSWCFAQTTNDTLIVGYTSAPPFIIENDQTNEGISVWLWNRCAKELQLDYKLVKMPFREILDSLQTGGIDVSINPLTITSKRLNNMSFTHPFYASQSVVVRGELSAFQRLKNFLGSFFSINFLSGFLILLFFIGIFGFMIWHFENKKNPQHFRRGIKGLWDGLWWSVVTMTTVGYGDKTPKSRGGKVVALVWMLSGLLFISGLTASVASSLTVNSLHIDRDTVKDFKSRVIGTIEHSSMELYLKDRFFRNIQLYPDLTAGLDAILKNEIEAFVYDESILSYRLLNDTKYSELSMLPAKFRTEFYAFGLPQTHLELSQKLSQKIFDITERNEWKDILEEYGVVNE